MMIILHRCIIEKYFSGFVDIRAQACKRFSAHEHFTVIFGEELFSLWSEPSQNGRDLPEPGVVVESMQM